MSFVTDQYAAFPSLHIGYALFLSLAIFLLTRNRLTRVLVAVYPVVLCAAIIITGNHYVLDVVAGVLVLGVAFVVNYGIAPQTVPEAIAVYARDADDRRR
jgi:membrane-associated phospholipid phosphatase